MINPFLDVNSEKTGVVEEELVSIQNDIELRPKFKKSYQYFWLQKKYFWLLSSIVEQGQDVLYCLLNIIFSGTVLQCSRLASFQAKKQTENHWTWGSTSS